MNANLGKRIVGYALQAVLLRGVHRRGRLFLDLAAVRPPAARARRWSSCRCSTPGSARRRAASAAPRSSRSSRPTCAPRTVCPRERAPVTVEIEMDGKPLFALVAPPTGLSRDGASTVYRRVRGPRGPASLRREAEGRADGGFDYRRRAHGRPHAGRVLVIDFDAEGRLGLPRVADADAAPLPARGARAWRGLQDGVERAFDRAFGQRRQSVAASRRARVLAVLDRRGDRHLRLHRLRHAASTAPTRRSSA